MRTLLCGSGSGDWCCIGAMLDFFQTSLHLTYKKLPTSHITFSFVSEDNLCWLVEKDPKSYVLIYICSVEYRIQLTVFPIYGMTDFLYMVLISLNANRFLHSLRLNKESFFELMLKLLLSWKLTLSKDKYTVWPPKKCKSCKKLSVCVTKVLSPDQLKTNTGISKWWFCLCD